MKEMALEGSAEKPRTDYDRHLKSAQPNASENTFDADKDGPPKFGGTVERVRGGRPRSTRVVAQAGFDLDGEPTVQFQALSAGQLKPLAPIEEEVRQSTQGFIDTKTSTAAARQRKAIERKSGRR